MTRLVWTREYSPVNSLAMRIGPNGVPELGRLDQYTCRKPRFSQPPSEVSLTYVGKGKKKLGATPQETVKLWTKAGKVKKKCCRSKTRCKKCPVLALKKAKKELAKAA